MRQETLFDGQLATEAAEDGMARASRAERVQLWKTQADAWLALRIPGERVTADNLVAAIGLPDEGVARNNVVGAWFSSKSKAGKLVFAGEFRQSQRIIGHSNLQRVWTVA